MCSIYVNVSNIHGVVDHINTVLDISVTISSFYKAYAEINSGMHDRLSKNWFQEIFFQ